MWKNFTDAFYLNFISDDRWHYIADGLKTTLIITFFACMMGIVLGFIVGMIRSTHDKTGKFKTAEYSVQDLPDSYPRYTCSCSAADHLFCCIWKCTH